MINLIHGDCLEVLKTIPDESVDAVVTDPPYGILKHKIESGIDVKLFLSECRRVLKPNSFLIYFGQQPSLTLWNSLAFELFNYKSEIIWYKRQRSSPMNDIGRVYENIMIVCNGTRKFNPVRRSWCDVQESLAEFREVSTYLGRVSEMVSIFKDKKKYEDCQDFLNSIDKSKFYTNRRIYNDPTTVNKGIKVAKRIFQGLKILTNGMLPQNLISFIPHNKQRFDDSGQGLGDHNVKHPTVKPIELMEYLIELVTNENDVILDPFMGSGTTGIACRNLNRPFIGIEIDAGYYDIAYQRIHQESQTQVSQEEEQDATQEVRTIQSPKQRSLF